jgi:hypothetical protein
MTGKNCPSQGHQRNKHLAMASTVILGVLPHGQFTVYIVPIPPIVRWSGQGRHIWPAWVADSGPTLFGMLYQLVVFD